MKSFMSGRAARRGGARLRGVVALAAVGGALALAVAVGVVLARRGEGATPPAPHGAPLRVALPGGDGVFLLTSRHRKHVLRGGRRSGAPTTWSNLEVDLWRFDAATARPVWTRRVLTEREGQPHDLALLGADHEVLWLFARGVRAVRADSGALLADGARLAALNPALRDVLPAERRWYAFGGDGLRITAADARVFRVDGPLLVAQPVAQGATAVVDRVVRPPFLAPSATYAFQRRGLRWPDRWLGVLADEEAETFRAAAAAAAEMGWPGAERPRALAVHRAAVLAPPALSAEAPLRYRLWTARVEPASGAAAAWGGRELYTGLAPLPESPEFLQGGLLAPGGDPAAPLVVRNPDGVLVLHRDRLGEEGRLRLTRVAAPGGRAVWEAALPLSVLQAVLPPALGERHLVLYGLAYTPPTGEPRDPAHDAHVVLVSVELATGAVQAWDVTGEAALGPGPVAAGSSR